MKFNKNANFTANLALNAGNFERENANLATNFAVNSSANLAMKFKPNFAVNLSTSGEILSQNENAVNLHPKRHKFTA